MHRPPLEEADWGPIWHCKLALSLVVNNPFADIWGGLKPISINFSEMNINLLYPLFWGLLGTRVLTHSQIRGTPPKRG